MKLLSRRFQPLPGWFYCRDCPARGHGTELDARQHTVISGHETRHVMGAQIIFRLPPDPAPKERQPVSRNPEPG